MKRTGGIGRTSGGLWPAWPLAIRERWFGADGFARLRHAPFALFVVAVLAYGAAFAWHVLDRFDLLDLLQYLSFDDAFYYFQIAHHMAEGRFSTFDGGLTRTNGYHPLWLFVITPFYWVFDKIEALFAIKAFEIMLLAGGVALVAVAARVARLPWFLLFAALPALYAQGGLLWGMEAALGAFALGLLLLFACLFARDPARWRWALAAVLFALPWVRLEYAAIAVAVSAMLGFIEWTGRLPGAAGTATGGSSSNSLGRADARPWRLQAAAPLAGAAAGILVYFAYNGIVFGGIVPVSGVVKALWSQAEWRQEGGYSLAKSIEVNARAEVFDDELLIALEVCVYVLVAWWLSRGSRNREDALMLAFLAGVFGLAACHLAKFAHSVLFMSPSYSFRYWYYVPAYLMEALVVPLRCFIGIYVLGRLLGPRMPRTCDVLRWAAIVAAGVFLAAKVDFAVPFRSIDKTREKFVAASPDMFTGADARLTRHWNVVAYMGTVVMERLLPEDTVLGAWDSGTLAYFSRFPVMNLDGLVNSYAYKEAIEDRAQRAFWGQHGIFNFSNVYGIGGPLRSLRLWEEVVSFSASRPGPQGTAALRLGFDLRVEDDHLVYEKVPCTRTDIAAPFFLHVFPASRDDIPKGRFFENRDFDFEHFGGWRDGTCLARVPLPTFEINHVVTGQIVTEVDFLFESAVVGRWPHELQFRLYRDEPEWVASPIDRTAWFRERMAQHLDPQADGIGLLVEGRTAQAFAWDCTVDANEVAEWSFGGEVGAVTDWTRTADGLCASALVLPHGHGEPVRVRRASLAEAVDGLAGGGPPAIRGDTTDAADATHPGGFDVYRTEDALVYVKAACERTDVETPFFLHVVPAGDDFDDGREAVGFNNLDFMLRHRGDWFGEEGEAAPCLAEVPLPSYPIAEIRTGQYAAEDFRSVWEGEIGRGQLTTEGA